MTVEMPDTEGALRTYLRAHADVAAVVAERVWFGIPRSPTWPLVVVAEQGGALDASTAPLAQDFVRFDCWGSLHGDGTPDKAEARAVRDAVMQALYDLNLRASTAGGVRLAGSSAPTSTYVPDPDDGRPRYVVVAQITAAKAAA